MEYLAHDAIQAAALLGSASGVQTDTRLQTEGFADQPSPASSYTYNVFTSDAYTVEEVNSLSSPFEPQTNRVFVSPDLGLGFDLLSTKLLLNLKIHLGRVRISADVYSVIVRRLDALLDLDEWEPTDLPPSIPSFDDMLLFLQTNNQLIAPRVAINKKGNFIISWRHDNSEQILTIEFLGGNIVRWLVFASPRAGETNLRRATGESSMSGILPDITAFDVLDWIARG